MTTIVYKDLPHKVGTAEISSPELKKVTMQFMENFLALGGQVSALQQVAAELQRTVAERSLAPSSGGDDEPSGGGGDSGGDAADRAAQQAAIAQRAADRAVLAAANAISAAQSAAAAAQWSTAFAISNLDFANTRANYRRFYLSGFVPDATKQYLVTVTFHQDSNATSGTTETICGIAVGNGAGTTPVGEGASLLPLDSTKETHKMVTVKPTNKKSSCGISISGEDAFFQITNSGTAAIGIAVKIALVAQGG